MAVLYTLKCEKCENVFEKKMKMGSGILPPCPKCSGKTRKVITGMKFVLKCGGFYSSK